MDETGIDVIEATDGCRNEDEELGEIANLVFPDSLKERRREFVWNEASSLLSFSITDNFAAEKLILGSRARVIELADGDWEGDEFEEKVADLRFWNPLKTC